jgi:hypothetical protein
MPSYPKKPNNTSHEELAAEMPFQLVTEQCADHPFIRVDEMQPSVISLRRVICGIRIPDVFQTYLTERPNEDRYQSI